MAAATVLPAMNGDGGHIHPFFRRHEANEDHEKPEQAKQTDHEDYADIDASDNAGQKPKPKRTRRPKPASDAEAKGKKQKTLLETVNPKAAVGEEEQALALNSAAPSSDQVTAPDRRKRRRTGQHEFVEVLDPVDEPVSDLLQQPSSPRVVVPASSPLPQQAHPISDGSEVPKTPPKKVLRLNANGKFSSPIKKSKDDGQASPGAPKRRGRPRKAKESEASKQAIVVMPYSTDPARWTDLGQRMDRILSGEERVELQTPKKKTTPRKSRTPKKSNKPTHPFFTGKAKEPPPPPKQESPRKATATTPGKLRRQVFGARMQEEPVPDVPYAVGSALLKDRLMVKHPGAQEPAWPSKEQTHVRGLDDLEEQLLHAARVHQLSLETRKRKTARVPFPPKESVLRRVDLKPEADSSLRSDGFRKPHASLRLPDKLLISGHEIRQQIRPELHARLNDDDEDEDELSAPTPSQHSGHPALRRLWADLPSAMTAWDKGRGESLGWAQKYAPVTAAEVLQPARGMTVLKDWLASLTIQAVESSSHPLKVVPKADPKPKKKRRRRPDDLDDFLVDSDEDLHSMDTLTDPEDVVVQGSEAQRSVIRVPAEGAKLSNAVLLSGPSGCGKTAAAYAVAKELGFKVFEINSHERRSGKDVLDRVGDMTENHLVKHHGHAEDGNLSSNEEANKARLDEAFKQDLASGRQGKMNAFFKPKAVVKPAVPPTKPKDVIKDKAVAAVQNALKRAPKDQQQSLILLEEVDNLFKDDKEFWATVFKLIISSKRPFIMTCNDEDLVPLQAMNLHAILRFTPPPHELAVDYMLLLAASEGHLLKRDAVAELYRTMGNDMRGSISELGLWCQMGVGDPRGGLAWIYQRWPPGCDIDAHGRKLRVVSKGTYQEGMGFPSQITFEREEDVLGAWKELGVASIDLVAWVPATDSAAKMQPNVSEHDSILREYDRYASSLSSIDMLSVSAMPDTAPLDVTQPDMPDKARNHYIEGMQLLQTDEKDDYLGLSAEMAAAAVSSLAHGFSQVHLRKPKNIDHQPKLSRHAYTCFDAISVPAENTLPVYTGITQSIFDGPISTIATDLAPYVRSIVQYDLSLEEYRERLSNLTSEGGGDGRKAKRARTTRAARSAMEGSQRQSTRRERWFCKGLDLEGVLRTGGRGWPSAVFEGVRTGEGEEEGSVGEEGSEAPVSSVEER